MSIRLWLCGACLWIAGFSSYDARADVSTTISIVDNICTGTCSVVGTLTLEVDDSEFFTFGSNESFVIRKCDICANLISAGGNWDFQSRVSSTSWGGTESVGYDYIQAGRYYAISHSSYALADGSFPEPDLSFGAMSSFVTVEKCPWAPGGSN